MTIYFDKIDNEFASKSSPLGEVNIPERAGLYRNGFKRVFDCVIILLAAPVVVPIVVILAIIVALDGNSPFFWNERVGKGGKIFRMLKLRTMVPDAEELLEHYLAANEEARAEWDKAQKLKVDPRITLFGRFLRKSSLDELPQLWNVLIGDMSLVGPRPMLTSQREMYPGRAYYALRPGLTGSWQVSDRNEVEFAKRADFDLDYDEQLSFPVDLKILSKTVGVVLKGTGY